jgi:hypothetical protein
MSKLHLLLIEADNMRNLGGSCMRDIINMDKYADTFSTKTNVKRGQTMVLSIDNKRVFKQGYTYDFLSNYIKRFPEFVNGVKRDDYVIVLIAGHGYQQRSVGKEEVDKLDEYISFGAGKITDNQLYSLLVSKLSVAKRVVCLADTCHSGTMFDNTPSTRNVISLSACLDNQFASCDIGQNTGYGGALTVHLLDQPAALQTMLLGTRVQISTLVKKIEGILRLLGQRPQLI